MLFKGIEKDLRKIYIKMILFVLHFPLELLGIVKAKNSFLFPNCFIEKIYFLGKNLHFASL